MAEFNETELAFLRGARLLGRLATVGADGMPHVAPVGWGLDAQGRFIEIGGRNFAATKKFRDVTKTGVAAIVIDEVLPPFRPRGVEIRGRAEALTGPDARIRIHPTRIHSWGLAPQ
ncbi:MAG TPA: PPOX class F420-dependent oxidoreductase [Thermopolyspora sp.]|jgi:Pyridoxamine 5''-phosphate oxidase.